MVRNSKPALLRLLTSATFIVLQSKSLDLCAERIANRDPSDDTSLRHGLMQALPESRSTEPRRTCPHLDFICAPALLAQLRLRSHRTQDLNQVAPLASALSRSGHYHVQHARWLSRKPAKTSTTNFASVRFIGVEIEAAAP